MFRLDGKAALVTGPSGEIGKAIAAALHAQGAAVDLSAPFRLARAALRGMLRRRAGRIVNIGSIVGATGNAGQANYAAAKAGLVGMSKALAQEVASRGITVNVVAPGFVVTPMTDALPEQQRTKLAEAIPLGR